MVNKGALLILVVAVVAAGLTYWVREDPAREEVLTLGGSSIRLKRNATVGGMYHLYGKDHLDYARALGFVHAKDRLIQMEFQRLAAQGRLSECILSSPELAAVDTYFRSLNFMKDAREAVPKLTPAARAFLEAYSSGVNHYLETHSQIWARPIEFVIISHVPEPWLPEHTLITAKLMAYVGLAETQGEIEKVVTHAIKAGLSMTFLRGIFPTQLENVDEEVIASIKQVDIQPAIFPEVASIAPYVPAFKASNNWVVGPRLSKSGTPIQCYDPHLDISRLPAIWYPFVFHYETSAKRYLLGASVPGMPAIFFGRNNDVSFGVTYGFMDQIDYFIEKVKDGKYMRLLETTNDAGETVVSEEWHEFRVRKEVIKQKEGPAIERVFYENDNGVVERDNYTGPLPDGLLMTRKWAWREFEPSDTSVMFPPPADITSMTEFIDMARDVPLSANWIVSDRQGNFGYQQSGRLPARDSSANSALPLLGWKASHRWAGSVDSKQLLRIVNPAKGFLATANDDLQNPAPDAPKALNYHMGFYRVSRIEEVIQAKSKNGTAALVTIDDMKELQLDVYSKQAEYYLELLEPALRRQADHHGCAACRALLEWDRRYDVDSVGATLYTELRQLAFDRLFGDRGFGAAAWHHLTRETGIALVFQWYFDRVLLWDIFERAGIKTTHYDFARHNRDIFALWLEFDGAQASGLAVDADDAEQRARDVRTRFVEAVVGEFAASPSANLSQAQPYGKTHAMTMLNIFWQDKLPAALGYNVGPIPLPGSGSTVNQGSLFKEGGREQSFCPSYRFISDLAQDWALTAIPGGVSERRFSGLYWDDFFFKGLYHNVSA